MKICAAIVFITIATLVIAADQPAATEPATTQPAASATTNSKCPVSGDPVDAKSKTVVHQGKTIAFCCDNCVAPFQKNPEKYAKNLK